MAFTVLRSGDEQQVNTITPDSQSHPTIARVQDGWIVTWSGVDASGGSGIYMQRYNLNGEPQLRTDGVVADRLVNTQTMGDQIFSSVTGLDNGGWVVSWIEIQPGATSGTIYQQRYDANGVFQGAQTAINGLRPVDHVKHIGMTALPNGEWLVTWQAGDGSNYGVYQQRFNADGTAQLDADGQLVNALTSGPQRFADVTALHDDPADPNDGGWVVAWVDGDAFSSTSNIHIRRYNAAGVAQSATDTPVVTSVGKQTMPKLAALPDGGWIMVWYGLGADGTDDIFLQQYNAAGVGGAVQVVNATTSGQQINPDVAVRPDGSWVVTWQSDADIYQRVYDRDASTTGTDVVVPGALGSTWNQHPQIVTLEDGRWVVTWQTQDQDDELSGAGISQRIFTPTVVQSLTTAQEIATGTAGTDTLDVALGGLSEGDIIDAREGDDDSDTLQMTAAGTINLTLPQELTGFEILIGSGGDDTILTSQDRLAQFTTLNGSAGSDTIVLFSGENYNLTGKTINGFEKIELTDYVDYTVSVDAVTTARLIHGGEGFDTVSMLNGTFTVADRIQLYSQGIDWLEDRTGGDTNDRPEVANLNGDQTKALVGTSVRLDADGDAVVTEDLERFESLVVTIANRVAGEDRLGVIASNDVILSNGVSVDSRVSVTGSNGTPVEIGIITEDGRGRAGLRIDLNKDAMPALVQTLIHALAYTNTAGDTAVLKQRDILVTLTDAAGASDTFGVGVNIAVNTGGGGNKAPVIDGTPTGAQQAADTGFISPFAGMTVSDLDTASITVTVAFDSAKGVLIPQGGGTYDPATGVYTITGTSLHVTLALRALQFNPKDVVVGSKETTDFTITVDDHIAPPVPSVVRVEAITTDRVPSQPTLSNAKVDELATTGKVVGTISATDPNRQDITYSLVGAENAPFEIVGAELRVKNGIALDHEQVKAYTFTIRATAGGISNDRVVTIDVGDVNPETTGGSDLDDRIVGGAGRDTLGGGLGNDTISGGLGNDQLKGDRGRDVFVFDTKPHKSQNADKITGFSVTDDSIYLDNVVFTKIGKGSPDKPLKLKKDMLFLGKAAQDASDRVVYDKKSGALYYDADGTGRTAQVKIATLDKNLKITQADFFVI